jgi:hypothetical protein
MSIPSVAATAIAVAVLLSGCAPSSTPTAGSGSPSPVESHPAFLAAGQNETDRLPGGVADSIQIAADSTRFQGNWDGREVFLGVKGTDSVCLVTGFASDAGSWKAGCGNGDGVVTDELPDGGTVKYLPMATSAAPEGWTRLSDFVFVM